MQLSWNPNPEGRPTSSQVQALIEHLYSTHRDAAEPARDDGYGSADFEERWQRLKPNSIPKLDEHVAMVHAPSTSMASHFTASDQELDHHVQDSLSVDMDTAVSRSSSIMSDKDMSVQIKSESLTNLHGSLEDVRNIYLTHNETAALECHQGNISLEDSREKEQDRSDASMDPWLKDIIAGSQDDVSYYKDVSDVIKNLDNILNSEKTSSSESSHQASPSRDNLSLDCKKDYPVQSSMVKSPGIINFQNILDTGFSSKSEEAETGEDDDVDRDTIGTLSHSFERHSEVDTVSQHTLENLTPDTPIMDVDVVKQIEIQVEVEREHTEDVVVDNETVKSVHQDTELPNENKIVSSDSEIPMLKELCVASIPSASDIEQLNVKKDCQTSCDSNVKEISTDIKNETKSIDDVGKVIEDKPHEIENKNSLDKIEQEQRIDDIVLPVTVNEITTNKIEQELKTIEDEVLPVTNVDSDFKEVLISDLIKVTENSKESLEITKEDSLEELRDLVPLSPQHIPDPVQSITKVESTNLNEREETEIPTIIIEEVKSPTPELPPEIVQNIFKEENENVADIDGSEKTMHEVNNIGNESAISRIEEVKEQVANVSEESYILKEHLIDELSGSERDKTNSEEVITEKFQNTNNYASFAIKPETNISKDVSDFIMEERKIAMLHDVKNVVSTELTDAEKVDKEFDFIIKQDLEYSLAESHQSEDILPQVNTEISTDLPKKENVTSSKDDSIINETDSVDRIVQSEYFFVTTEKDDTTQVAINTPTKEPIIKTEDFKDIPKESVSATEKNVYKDVSLPTDTDSNIPETVAIIKTEMEKEGKDSNPKEEITHVPEEASPSTVDQKLDETFQVSQEYDPLEECLVSVEADVSVKTSKFEETSEKQFDVKPKESEHSLQESLTNANAENVNASPTIDCNVPTPVVEELININVLETSISSEETKQNVIDDKIARSDSAVLIDIREQSDDSTAYMDLINDINNEMIKDNTIDTNVKNVIQSCLDSFSTDNACSLINNESTEYLDLPSFGIKEVDNFLHMERVFNSNNANVVSSTPLASDSSVEVNNTIENSAKEDETQILCETKVPDYGMGVSLTKLEQKYVPDSMSPFESPTKSHHTDTYDENSSVVLGPFENCTLELFKGVKSSELVDLPKEELLAFSSNFSEMNLETPSPLRDGNFLNEVPDIMHDDIQFDDVQSLSEKQSDPQTETDSGNSGTEKRISPSTPPNSPGIFLASTSQQKYLVDIDLTPEPAPLVLEPELSLQNEIELNQIELQITSKLAMAENENNMNIEYSGPLTVEGLVSDEEMLLRESDSLPESYLAGNGGSVEDLREDLRLDEECVKALRNELELKLPLAQVSSIPNYL